MNKLSRINFFMAFFLIIMAFVGLREAYGDIQKYGWTYTLTTTIGEESVETVVSISSQIFATIFLGFIGIVLLANSRVVGQGHIIDFTLKDDDTMGITFPQGKPAIWDFTIDQRTRIISVTLNDSMMSFPLSMVQGWVEQYEKKKTKEMK